MVIALAVCFIIMAGCTLPDFQKDGAYNGDGVGIANPASEHCAKMGGRLNIVKETNGEYGVCEFANGAKCEEWAYYKGECSPEKPNYCTTDSDCACGTHIKSGECFVGSKEFVNVEKQCPDYCTGIGGMFETRCVNHQCKIIKKEQATTPEQNVGPECTSVSDCQKGADCYRLPGYAKPRCYFGDPCELCPPEKDCTVSTSFPAIVKCVEKDSKPGEGFCGWSTDGPCESDKDCIHGGCNSQICQSKSEGILVSSCEWKDCYRPTTYGVVCRCIEGKCKWSK